ncbi:hypothetical protein LTR37_010782 [Vermiconidia calcicola]|uniref:Uncharacterized protein n=1 Tax=Vermiconidia calcicola TaxID=1690605 RepID=A0ACC3N3W2_9PEZI|nr:hypothetical protein LTR37_010782 [Vermiconidia calcicola]
MPRQHSRQLITVELAQAREHLTGILETSFNKALDRISAHASKSHAANSEGDIQGLRAQITANVSILAPKIKKDGTVNPSINQQGALTPVSTIITAGVEPKITALVMEVTAAGGECILRSKKAATTVGALKDLLKESEKLLATHLVNDGNKPKSRRAIFNTPTKQTTPKAGHFRKKTNDRGFWGSEGVKNPSFTENGSFDSPGSDDSGFESGGNTTYLVVGGNDGTNIVGSFSSNSSTDTVYDPYLTPERADTAEAAQRNKYF